MFSSFFEVARNSPFRTPFTRVQCDNGQVALTTPAPSFKDPAPVVGREIAAAATPSGDSCEFGSNKYFALCGIGGILSCGTTHTFVVPLDLVKCRLQVNPAKYKNVIHGVKVTVAEEGARGLAKGWFPTLIGYSLQVSCTRHACVRPVLKSRISFFWPRDIDYRVCANSVSTKCSRLSTQNFWARRTLISTVHPSTWRLRLPLRSLPTLLCRRSRPLRLRFRPFPALPTLSVRPCPRCSRRRASLPSTRVWCHCGCVKSHTP